VCLRHRKNRQTITGTSNEIASLSDDEFNAFMHDLADSAVEEAVV
jgi:preprotein translocase subunit SecA